jgi:hypothetical protein
VDDVAEIDDATSLVGRRLLDSARTLVRLLDDLQPVELDRADHREPEMPHEQLTDLLLGLLAGGQIEPEALGRESAAVGEGDSGVEMSTEVRHPLSPYG